MTETPKSAPEAVAWRRWERSEWGNDEDWTYYHTPAWENAEPLYSESTVRSLLARAEKAERERDEAKENFVRLLDRYDQWKERAEKAEQDRDEWRASAERAHESFLVMQRERDSAKDMRRRGLENEQRLHEHISSLEAQIDRMHHRADEVYAERVRAGARYEQRIRELEAERDAWVDRAQAEMRAHSDTINAYGFNRLVSTPVVSKEAVEAGAIALWQEVDPARGAWDNDAENFRREARAAITAAILHMTPDSPSAESEGDETMSFEDWEEHVDEPEVARRVMTEARPATLDSEPSASDPLDQIKSAWSVVEEAAMNSHLYNSTVHSALKILDATLSQPSAGREVSREEFKEAVRAGVEDCAWVHLSTTKSRVRAQLKTALESLGISITPAPESE